MFLDCRGEPCLPAQTGSRSIVGVQNFEPLRNNKIVIFSDINKSHNHNKKIDIYLVSSYPEDIIDDKLS